MARDFVEKQIVASSTKHARKLIGRCDQRRGAARNDGLKIFERPRIVADVRMAIDKPWRDVGTRGVDNLRARASIALGARTDVANAPVDYCDFVAGENFAGVDVD